MACWLLAGSLCLLGLTGCGGEKKESNPCTPENSCATESSTADSSEDTAEESSTVALSEPFTMYFFHDTACGSCDGTSEFYEAYNRALEGIDRDAHPCQLLTYNIFQTGGNQVWKELTAEWGLDAASISCPALLVNGRVFSGLEQIEKNVREQYLLGMEGGFMEPDQIGTENALAEDELFDGWEADPEHLTIAYFYRYTCPECEETRPFIDGLPEEVEVDGKMVPLDVVKINTRGGRGGDRVMEMFRDREVPEEDQVVPIVFLADGYLAGYDAISGQLLAELEKGNGLGFTWPEGENQDE